MQTVAAAIREDLSQGQGCARHLRAPRRGPAAGARPAGRAAAQDRRHARRARPGRAARHGAGARPSGWRRSWRGRSSADEATLVEIAATLIGVEDRLDDGLVGMILPKDERCPSDRARITSSNRCSPRCCASASSISRASRKRSHRASAARWMPAGLDSWQDLMRGMKAALLMLGKTRAVDVIEGHHHAVEARHAAGRARCCRWASRPVWPMPSSASSTTWRRCRPDAAIPGTCSTTRRPVCRRSSCSRPPPCPRCRR